MNDSLRDAFAAQVKDLPASTPEMGASWPLSFGSVSLKAFKPFGIIDLAPPSLSTEWLFDYDKQDAAPEVRAMFTGLITWVPAESTLRLESLHHPSEILNLLDEEWPEWMPIARVLEYRLLESASVRQAVGALVSGFSPAQRAVIDANTPELAGVSPTEMADRFLSLAAGTTSRQIVLPVRQGQALGSGEVAGTGRRFSLRARERVGSTYFVNLAYHAAKLRSLRFLPDPPISMAGGGVPEAVRAALIDANGPVIGSGTVRTVAQAGGMHTTVRAAVQAAAAGDLVLITDASTYQSSTTILIDKPLVITSKSTVDARTSAAGLPTLRGVKPADPRNRNDWAPTARRAIEIVGKHNGQPTFTDGVVQLSSFAIDQSAASHGGGIWVDDCHRVIIENIRFSDNEAFGGGWLYEGFGGALGVRHSGVLVRRCAFLRNAANCRGGGMGVFGYGWPIVTDCQFEGNRSAHLGVQNPDPDSGRPYRERPDGGGLGIQMATPNTESLYSEVASFVQRNQGMSLFEMLKEAAHLSYGAFVLIKDMAAGDLDRYWDRQALVRSRRNAVVINRCGFKLNTSRDDGGGVYATGLVRARLRDCTFEANKADHNGGGLRISTACDAIVRASTFSGNESNAKNLGYECEEKKDGTHEWHWIRHGGGAVAARTSNLKLVDVTIRGNKGNRFAGGGLFFTSTDEGPFQGAPSGIRNDWNTVRDLLVRCGSAPCPEFRRFSLVIEGGSIRENACGWTVSGSIPTAPAPAAQCGAPLADWSTQDQLHAKGGGIYALRNADDDHVYPPISVSISVGTTLTANAAAFSATATDLFVADNHGPAGAQNPAADTGALVRDAAGVLTTAYLFEATP